MSLICLNILKKYRISEGERRHLLGWSIPENIVDMIPLHENEKPDKFVNIPKIYYWNNQLETWECIQHF